MKSSIAVSMHKAGSSIADRIFVDIAKAAGYEIERISSKAMQSELAEPDFFHEYQSLMRPEGVYYGMARHWKAHDMEVLPKLRILAQIRDPRDCLTSAFFSFGGSHQEPKLPSKRAAFLERRKKIQEQGIDTYVLGAARNYAVRAQTLRNLIENHPDILLLHYEEMVTDTESWLKRISNFFEQPITESLRSELGEKINFEVDQEDPTKHKRRVTPGDHRRKLKSETIDKLNVELGSALDYFGYEK